MANPQAERIPKELLSEAVLPVILGNGLAAHRLALRLRLRYGMSSLLCGARISLWDRLHPGCGFLELMSAEDGRLLTEQLIDLADHSEDGLLLLVLLSDGQRTLLSPYCRELESRFILTEPCRLLASAPRTVLSLGKVL